MRHRKKLSTHFGGRDWGHVDSMMRNLLTSLCLHKSLTTTEKRAVLLDRAFDRLVTFAKRSDERVAIREIMRHVTTEEASKILLSEIIPATKDRTSGYLYFTTIKYRSGDGAKLVKVELI